MMDAEVKGRLLACKWKGYYWLSDRSAPCVMVETEALPSELLCEGRTPFVVEANLISEDGARSVSMAFADGRLIVNEFDASKKPNDVEESFVAHRMPGVARLKFIRRWREVPDELCLGWPVLVPAERVFIGLEPQGAMPDGQE